jgi:ElaA protein
MSVRARQPAKATLRREWAGDLTTEQLYALLRLRVEVFVVEQNCPYPELDGRDLLADTRHFWLESPDQPGVPIACARLLTESESAFRVGRMCVAAHARDRGLARRLIEGTMAEVGSAECVLDAQLEAEGLYASFGFTRVGEEFVEDGIRHVAMRRTGR